MTSLLISTLVYILASSVMSYYANRWELPRGFSRWLLIGMLAYLPSWGASEAWEALSGEPDPTRQVMSVMMAVPTGQPGDQESLEQQQLQVLKSLIKENDRQYMIAF